MFYQLVGCFGTVATRLFTAGYEGASIESFIAGLAANGIDCVLDVRELPLSRKPGFSKTQLAQALQDADIRYVHLRNLGTPKSIRKELKSGSDYETFFNTMDGYLATQREALDIAYEHVMNGTCCLMCFERHAERCHRKLVAEKIKVRDGNGLQITHI
jgi:uncharacterized protein (DUF488 family)